MTVQDEIYYGSISAHIERSHNSDNPTRELALAAEKLRGDDAKKYAKKKSKIGEEIDGEIEKIKDETWDALKDAPNFEAVVEIMGEYTRKVRRARIGGITRTREALWSIITGRSGTSSSGR